MSNLTMIVLATLLGGLLSMVAAAGLVFRLSRRSTATLVAFAAGVMLSSALLEILPEAFTSLPQQMDEAEHLGHGHGHGHGHDHDAPAVKLFAVLLAGLLGFFALERLALWRHSHAGCDAAEGEHQAEVAAPLILLGDAFHNFVDGLLIAAAFLADPMLGVTTTLAAVAHEIPQELSDFVLLLNAGWSRRQAFMANSASSLTSVLGGLLGYFALDGAEQFLPYVLTIAAASFIYIAVADLLPLLHRQRSSFALQSALIGVGVMVVPLVGQWVH
jgi:zinc and cadmium transporter